MTTRLRTTYVYRYRGTTMENVGNSKPASFFAVLVDHKKRDPTQTTFVSSRLLAQQTEATTCSLSTRTTHGPACIARIMTIV